MTTAKPPATRPPPACPTCQRPFAPAGRQRYCSHACRQTAYRRRTAPPAEVTPTPPTGAASETVYECPDCDQRYLGTQRCPDCNTFARRVGPGGACPHCDEPVAVADLESPPML